MKLFFLACCLTVLPLAVHAQTPPKPKTPPVVAPAPPVMPSKTPGSLADLMAGRVFPLTLSIGQLNSSFHSVALVDAQGKPGGYVSKGEIFAVGSETFLVTYYISAPAPLPDAAGVTPPDATLMLINLRAVQAMGNFGPVPPITLTGPPPTVTPAPPATPPAAGGTPK